MQDAQPKVAQVFRVRFSLPTAAAGINSSFPLTDPADTPERRG